MTLVKVKSVKVGCKAKAGAHCTAASQPFCPTDWSLGGFSLPGKVKTQWRKVKDTVEKHKWRQLRYPVKKKTHSGEN